MNLNMNYQQPTTEQVEKIKQEFFNIVWSKAMEAKETSSLDVKQQMEIEPSSLNQ